MNQEQLLDKVAAMIVAEAQKGAGTLALYFDEDYQVLRLPKMPKHPREMFEFFDCEEVTKGLPPSTWSRLSRTLWREFCQNRSKNATVKFPARKQPAEPDGPANPDGPGKPPAA